MAEAAAKPLPVDPAFDADDFLSNLKERLSRRTGESLPPDLAEAARPYLVGLASNSEHFRDQATMKPELLAALLSSDPDSAFQTLLQEVAAAAELASVPELMTRLRELKVRMSLLTMLADTLRIWRTQRVVAALTEFADACVGTAVKHLLTELARKEGADPARDPVAEGGYIVLAMGKHGAFELNYSSDIDLIVLYEPERSFIDDNGRLSKQFVRLTQALLRILQERTGDGYVFRTDLRLRPDPSATPLAVSVPAALHYYEARGQNWERAALIKARAIAGDITAGKRFLTEIKPFIWRRFLDYSTVADIQRIKRQINATRGLGEVGVRGQNVKLGRGGIREIEFFVQTQQLIAGGRHPELHCKATVDGLASLAEGGWIEPATRDDLTSAYWCLREIEHRLQMRADEQTHDLPSNDAALASIARLCGYDDLEEFTTMVMRLFRTVCRHSDALFADTATDDDEISLNFSGDDVDESTLQHLTQLGFERAGDVAEMIRAWLTGRYAATRSQASRERLRRLMPALLARLAENDNPDGAVISFDRILQRLPAGVQLFSLLLANPGLLDVLTRIMGTAPRLADTIVARPHILDPLLEPEFFQSLPDRSFLEERARELLDSATSYEERLDLIRIFGREQQFLIGARVLSETLTPSEAALAYTDVADVLISSLMPFVAEEFAAKHGTVVGGRTALLAMGKLGSNEMTPASDLDLILLYDFDPDCQESDGQKRLAARQYFMRLTQRFVAAVSAPTAQGTLYEVDFRLRPSGNAGPLATHIDAFRSYQREQAWTWEHMALTRARPICGGDGLDEEAGALISEVISRPRDWPKLRDDALEMRGRLERDKSGTNPWEVKQVPGGLIDIEFIAQVLVLRYAADHPSIARRTTALVLAEAKRLELLSPEHASLLEEACTLYHSLTQLQRLCVAGKFDADAMPRGFAQLVCRARALPNIEAVTGELIETEKRVREIFNAFFEREETVPADA